VRWEAKAGRYSKTSEQFVNMGPVLRRDDLSVE
jgi:hypothetical protein